MREIKFRGKQKLTNKWIFGNLQIKKTKLNVETLENELYDTKCSIQYFTEGCKVRVCEVFENSVGQYIGVKDKNGTEIYERRYSVCDFRR